MAKVLWDDIAAAIRGMDVHEMQVFQDRYGIAIVSQDTKKMKKFSAMSPEEKKAFLSMHRIEPQDVGL